MISLASNVIEITNPNLEEVKEIEKELLDDEFFSTIDYIDFEELKSAFLFMLSDIEKT